MEPQATYSAYFGEVTRLNGWYFVARKYAVKRRKSAGDRAEYLEAVRPVQRERA